MDLNLYNYTENETKLCITKRRVLLKVRKRNKIYLQEAKGFIPFAFVQDPNSLLEIQMDGNFRIENIIKEESIKLRTYLPDEDFQKLDTIEVIIIDKTIFVRLINGKETTWNSFWHIIGKQVNIVLQRILSLFKTWIKGFGISKK